MSDQLISCGHCRTLCEIEMDLAPGAINITLCAPCKERYLAEIREEPECCPECGQEI